MVGQTFEAHGKRGKHTVGAAASLGDMQCTHCVGNGKGFFLVLLRARSKCCRLWTTDQMVSKEHKKKLMMPAYKRMQSSHCFRSSQTPSAL
mmetsp:Transcript_61796/g.102772  ORF Transcript_61796/g.102772 Transcript_61796/m.102772 type:complete len:91 (-) Transcript_61796:247-519(-)